MKTIEINFEAVRREICEIARSIIELPIMDPKQVLSSIKDISGSDRLETKTTVVAFITKDGAVIGADSRGSLGFRIAEGTLEKLFVIDTYSVLGISGFAGDGQIIARYLEREFERFSTRFHQPHPKSKANRVGMYLRAIGGCVPVFVTYDHSENRARIFSYDEAGHIQEMKDGFASVGSGSLAIRSQVEEFARRISKVNADYAIADVIYLLKQASRYDSFTGGDFSICTVTSKGVTRRVVPEVLWRLNDLLGQTTYPSQIESKIFQQVLNYIEQFRKRQREMTKNEKGGKPDGN